MVNDYKKYELFGKTLIQKIELAGPFRYDFPVAEQACFIYVMNGELQYKSSDKSMSIPEDYSLFLNCINSGKHIHNSGQEENCHIVIVTFYPDILKRDMHVVAKENDGKEIDFFPQVSFHRIA